jgi:hypothetical protein
LRNRRFLSGRVLLISLIRLAEWNQEKKKKKALRCAGTKEEDKPNGD